MSRLVVADTGPLIHLAQADVLDELERGQTDISEGGFAAERVKFNTESTHPHLDPGETAALVLCTERDAVLLTDDLDARNTAKEEEIEVHGSVGVVLYGYSQRALSEAATKRVLRELEQETNLYLSTPLIEHTIELVEADDAEW